MVPGFCGVAGFAGWLVALLVWTGLVSLAVWGIARLFPGPARRTGRPARRRAGTAPAPAEAQASSLIGTGRP